MHVGGELGRPDRACAES